MYLSQKQRVSFLCRYRKKLRKGEVLNTQVPPDGQLRMQSFRRHVVWIFNTHSIFLPYNQTSKFYRDLSLGQSFWLFIGSRIFVKSQQILSSVRLQVLGFFNCHNFKWSIFELFIEPYKR